MASYLSLSRAIRIREAGKREHQRARVGLERSLSRERDRERSLQYGVETVYEDDPLALPFPGYVSPGG